jgi:hypothetical protein
MVSTTLSRKNFLDLLQAGGSPERVNVRLTDRAHSLAKNSDDVQLIWDEDVYDPKRNRNRALPNVILVASGKKRDFLAWSGTYIPEYRPLTAYTRVLDEDEFTRFSTTTGSPWLGTLEEACLGLIVGEAATYVENKQERKLSLTPLSCAGTCSFVMARVLALSEHQEFSPADEGILLWQKARALARQRPLRLKPTEIILPWLVLFEIYAVEVGNRNRAQNVPEPIHSICMHLHNDSEIDPRSWDLLSAQFPTLRGALREMEGNREKRVLFFERFLFSLRGYAYTDIGSFACGLLASQIGPGTLDYLPLILPSLDQFPTALLWYGLCSGLQRKSSLYGFSNGLGRRVLREVLRNENIFDSPLADIALAELEVLATNDSVPDEFRTGALSSLGIELLPSVITSVRWPPRLTDQQPELFPSDDSAGNARQQKELQELAAQVEDLALRMSRLQQRIYRILGDREPVEGRQGKRPK